eukprot:gb/GFBE01030459.1/.p1 GENE.gb/GFBE01030459.1/~~gb/GFBE01030459.1/.p1  ORF type:complete len:361 (+),score=43.59 gb/GFBE01030459.1/:1-1083(+)
MVGRIRDPLTGSIRTAGKKDSRNEDRDANPMNDALPGEVVRRSAKKNERSSGPSAKALAETDLQAVLAKGSGTREKWLKKALQQVQDGDLQAVEVYDIIKVADFASDLKDKTGRSIYRLLMSRLSLFSKGQQRFLSKECALAQYFGSEGSGPPAGSQSSEVPRVDGSLGEGEGEAAEDMMARVRAFVRQQQGLDLDQAIAVAHHPDSSIQSLLQPMQPMQPMLVHPMPTPVEAVLAQPAVAPPRQDMSAVANIIARASSAAVKSEAVKSEVLPPTGLRHAASMETQAGQDSAALKDTRSDEREGSKRGSKLRAASSSSSRAPAKKKRRRPLSSSRSRSPSRRRVRRYSSSRSRDGRNRTP